MKKIKIRNKSGSVFRYNHYLLRHDECALINEEELEGLGGVIHKGLIQVVSVKSTSKERKKKKIKEDDE